MTATTVRHSKKPFAWSYSRLKNYETCPRRHQQIDILKNFKDESEQLNWGDRVHKAAAARLGNDKPLEPELEPMLGKWIAKILKAGGKIHVEQKLAITADHKPCEFFGQGVWFRTVIDVVQAQDNVAGIYDWKTGKIIEDSVQLALAAACVFAHYPRLQAVKSVFIWLKEDATTTEKFTRADIPAVWDSLKDRIEAMRSSYANDSFPPTHNKLCRQHCVVRTCEFHGVSTWS